MYSLSEELSSNRTSKSVLEEFNYIYYDETGDSYEIKLPPMLLLLYVLLGND